MDAMSPELVWHAGSCYRINNEEALRNLRREPKQRDDLEKSNTYIEHDDDEEEDEDIEYTTMSSGRIKTILHVAFSFYGFIIGKKGITLKRIMNETRTDVKLPPRGIKGDIIITGPDTKCVASAVRRIKMIVHDARRKQMLTHFLSIPINSKQVLNNYNKFKETILLNPPRGVEESIFIVPTKLHITLCVLSLMDEEERTLAVKLLNEAQSEIIEPLFNGTPVEFYIKGVSYMEDDPKLTHVLYAELHEKKDDDKGIICELATQLTDFFSKNGFESFKNRRPPKLHITLMNSKKREETSSEDGKSDKVPFDSTDILKEYADYYFGEQTIEEIHISQMNRDLEYYPSTAYINISN